MAPAVYASDPDPQYPLASGRSCENIAPMATAKKKTKKKTVAKKKTPAKKKTVAKKKAIAKRVAARKAPAKRRAPAKKAAPKRNTTAKKTATRRPAAKKKRVVAKKAPPKKRVAAKKPVAKKAPPKKPAKKKSVAKKAQPTAATTALRQQRQAALAAKSVAELKAMLRNNDQLTTGSKPELMERVLDRVENGNLPRCPECYLGRLRVDRKGAFSCPGGYDDDEYKACGFTATASEVTRPTWQFETAGVV